MANRRATSEAFPNAIAAKFATTVIVKTMDNQLWVCRTHSFQSMAPFSVKFLAP